MIKKLIAFILVAMLLLSLSACGSSAQQKESGAAEDITTASPESNVLDGFAVRGSDAQNNRENASRTVNDWLTLLGY